MKPTFLILDGNSLLHRAWHAIPPLTTKDGRVVNAAYGFTMVIEKMREQFKPDFMAVAWDLPGGTFRDEIYTEYKATRAKKEDELYAQIEIIQEILRAYGVPSLSVPGFEADDILGTIATTFGKTMNVLILTGDLDSLQLVNGAAKVVVFVKGLSEVKEYDEAAVKERYGLVPAQLIDLKALMGDSSDNIPGIAGVGKKTAETLLAQYGTIEGIYDAIEESRLPEKFAKKFRGQESQVEMMKKLVTIVRDVKLEGFTQKDAEVHAPDVAALLALFEDLEFRRLIEKYKQLPEKVAPANEAPSVSAPVKTVGLNAIASDEIFIAVERGQKDLFGNSVKAIAVHDGKRMAVLDAPKKEDIAAVVAVMKKAKRIVGHDVKVAMHALDFPADALLTADVFDVMVGAYLLSPGSRVFDLPTALREHTGKKLKEGASVADCVSAVHELAVALEGGIKKEDMWKLAVEIEMPLIPVLYMMEAHGVAVDGDHLNHLSEKFGREIEELTKNIFTLAGREFNINSPSQLADILFDDLLLPTTRIKRTKNGYSTAASELEKLWDAHAIIPLISEYRELAKLKSTYADSLPLLVGDDGRIHTTYKQTIAATGRLSSVDPNLQNIPIRTSLGNEIRKAFVAPPGTVLVSMDYSQIELRLAAVYAKDESFLRAFKEGADIHRRTASEVLGIPEEDVTKEQRYAAKAINFGILYGMGPRNLAKTTGFSRDEAQAFLDRYFEIHHGIRQYIDEMKLEAHKNEFVTTLFGRKRYLPDINGGVQMLVAAAERMAVNMPLQGTQADLIKMAMIEIQAWLTKERPDVKMILQVHDALVFEMSKDAVDDVVPKLQGMMANVHAFDVPLLVEVDVGTNWGELEKWDV